MSPRACCTPIPHRRVRAATSAHGSSGRLKLEVNGFSEEILLGQGGMSVRKGPSERV